jgi:hypothetical protein
MISLSAKYGTAVTKAEKWNYVEVLNAFYSLTSSAGLMDSCPMGCSPKNAEARSVIISTRLSVLINITFIIYFHVPYTPC